MVEAIADEAPGPDPDLGKLFVWLGAFAGAMWFGTQASDIIGTISTNHDVEDILIWGAVGAVAGAPIGLLVWTALLFVLAFGKRLFGPAAPETPRAAAAPTGLSTTPVSSSKALRHPPESDSRGA